MNSTTKYRQPWLKSAGYDSLFILSPALVALAVSFFLPETFKRTDEMPVGAWVFLVLFIDVAHVYSTLFTTYFNKARFAAHRALYIAVPLACFVASVILYSMGALLFWRVLAYLAVFHFIRQQYGFMRLYSRFESSQAVSKFIDVVAIYAVTLYPIVYWHCTPGRNFSWFIEEDFMIAKMDVVSVVAGYIYCSVVVVYLVKECFVWMKYKQVNLPKNVHIISTACSWYFGIVYFNGDLAFTLLNVVAHGIPYMALVWLHSERTPAVQQAHRHFYKRLLFFVVTILLLAYFEEGLWDGLVWKEHAGVFSMFSFLPRVDSSELLSILIPLLSLPQSTHYVLDGFIWKKKHDAGIPASKLKVG